jgi:hypothetical protein
MPSYLSLPRDPYKLFRSRKEKKATLWYALVRNQPQIERFEWIIWGAKLCLHFQKNQMKTQVSELNDAREFESMLFHYPITQDNMVDTSKFTSVGETWNILYACYISRRWPILVLHLYSRTSKGLSVGELLAVINSSFIPPTFQLNITNKSTKH